MPTRFTPTELQTLHNKNFFYIKESAIEKIQYLFSDVRDEIKNEVKEKKIVFPAEVDESTGKIFRGENYLGLPYLVLDYPKYFSKDSVFSFRTMFWWGNFFSCTLHLQGKVLDERRNLLIQNWKSLRKKNIHICVGKTPWHYYYKKDNYMMIDRFSETELKQFFITKEFIKFSKKIPLKDYKKLNIFCKESFSVFSSSLSSLR